MNAFPGMYKNLTVHRSLTKDPINGILSCGFLTKSPAKSGYEAHEFPYYGALLVLSGTGLYSDATGRKISLSPGCFVQRMPGKPHITEVSSLDWLEFFVCFGRDFYEVLAQQGLLSREPVLFQTLSDPLLESCRLLFSQFQNAGDSQLFSVLLAAEEFVLSLTQSALSTQYADVNGKLSQAAAFLCSAQYLSPVEAAKRIHMEYETFRKQFKIVFRCSPSAYQMRYRLNFSKQLLLDSQKSIQEIAECTGFSDAFAFSKAFRHFYGIAPSQFRKRSF